MATCFSILAWKIAWAEEAEEMATRSSILAWKIAWAEEAEEMATRSSILAWKIAWAEQVDGLQCMGPQKLDTTEQSTFVLYVFCVFYLPRLLKYI